MPTSDTPTAALAPASRWLLTFRSDESLPLELGGSLPGVTVAYETYGTLNAARNNAVLICHALSGDSHVARHDADDEPGWWDRVVGPGRPIDTDRWFVICPNVLGGCRGSTGPSSIDPRTGRRYAADFPDITLGDMVEAQKRLIDGLGVDTLHAIVGGSLGGHQALMWATRHNDRSRGYALLATSPRLTSQALAFDIVGRNAILRDPGFHDGRYEEIGDRPTTGLALARMLGHITYLSREGMAERFDPDRLTPRDVPTAFEKAFSVGSYLAYQGHKFVERFDANSYVTITRAMDRFDLGDDAPTLAKRFANVGGRFLVVSFSSDWLFPPFQSRQIVDGLCAAAKRVSYCDITSDCGHDAFLLDDDLPVYGRLLGDWMTDPPPDLSSVLQGAHSEADVPHPTSIFHGRRVDHDLILSLIPPHAAVLDLGCGRGELLARLRRRGQGRVVGVELSELAVVEAIGRGVDVIRADLNRPAEALRGFADDSFDIVVLSQALQSVTDTAGVMREMLRVGRRGIVSYPNFAYRRLREMLYREGRSPKAAGQYAYEWYDTPNRRFPSVLDFRDFCRASGLRVEREIFLDTERGVSVSPADDPNLHADLAIAVVIGGG